MIVLRKRLSDELFCREIKTGIPKDKRAEEKRGFRYGIDERNCCFMRSQYCYRQ